MNCNTTLPESSYHTIDCLEERGAERESAGRSSLKGREGAIVNQTNIGTASKAALGELLRDRVERIWAHMSAYIPSLTELNCLNKAYLKTNKN